MVAYVIKLISLHSLADLSEEVVVGVSRVEFHVVPEVDGDAPVRLTQVVKPQTWQVQYVPRHHPDVEWVGVLKFWNIVQQFMQRLQRKVHRFPFPHVWSMISLYEALNMLLEGCTIPASGNSLRGWCSAGCSRKGRGDIFNREKVEAVEAIFVTEFLLYIQDFQQGQVQVGQ